MSTLPDVLCEVEQLYLQSVAAHAIQKQTCPEPVESYPCLSIPLPRQRLSIGVFFYPVNSSASQLGRVVPIVYHALRCQAHLLSRSRYGIMLGKGSKLNKLHKTVA